ncbi:MAG: beta-propeller fold lactonase family protein, partial [Saprospiraceae bacterium]
MQKIICFVLFSIAGLMANPLAGQADYFLVVGTYSTTPADGIEVFSFDSHNGAFQFVQKTAAKNPSFLAISPDQKHLYA